MSVPIPTLMEDVSVLIRRINDTCQEKIEISGNDPEQFKPEIEAYFELVRCFWKVAIKKYCDSNVASNNAASWAKPISDKLLLSSDETTKIQSILSVIDDLFDVRNQKTHRHTLMKPIRKLVVENQVDRKIEALFVIFADKRLEASIIPEVFRKMPKRPEDVVWIQFWRKSLESNEILQQEKIGRILEELKRIPSIKSQISINSNNLSLIELAVIMIHRLDMANVELLYEILESPTIRANLAAEFDEICSSENYKYIQGRYKEMPKRYLLQAVVSESEPNSSSLFLEMYECVSGREPVRIGEVAGSATELTEFCLDEISKRDEKYSIGNIVFQWLGEPQILRQFYSRDRLIELRRFVSVVAVAPRKGKRLKQREIGRLKKTYCSGVNEKNRFVEVRPAKEELVSKSFDRIDELWAGWNTSLVEDDWAGHSESVDCEFLESFEENLFFMVVLCAADQPEEDWEKISNGKDQVSVEEFLELFSEHQKQGILSAEQRCPRLLYQDAQFEKRHRARSL